VVPTTRRDDNARHFMQYPYGTPRAPSVPLGPLAPALIRATTHGFATADEIRIFGARQVHTDFYPRYGHSNGRDFEAFVAELEGAEGAVAFASGMAATAAVMFSLCSAGDRVAVARQCYGGTISLATKDLPRFGMTVDVFDALDARDRARALAQRPKLCIIESPINPTLRLVDVAATAGECRAVGTLLMVDATFGPPPLQRLLGCGADLVMHSATKYLGGHSDVLAGVIAGRHELLATIESFRARSGAMLGADGAWLLCRSAATHTLRVNAQQDAAVWLARALRERAGPRSPLASVIHPSLEDHPDRTLRERQMPGGGGAMLSIEVRGGLPAAIAVSEALRVVARAPSLGGVESVVSLPAHTSHALLPATERAALGIGDGMLRISVGLEPRERLLADLLGAIGIVE
jgi:cystathionine beta-lyase/cystathionine gamma-synthase